MVSDAQAAEDAALEEVEQTIRAVFMGGIPPASMSALRRYRDTIIANRAPLFETGAFTLHTGEQMSTWKVECDALSTAEWETLAGMAIESVGPVRDVIGVPRGGVPFADALRRVLRQNDNGRVLVVDDVLTTGESIREIMVKHNDSIGLVAFARGPLPERVRALWMAGDAYAARIIRLENALRQIARMTAMQSALFPSGQRVADVADGALYPQ